MVNAAARGMGNVEVRAQVDKLNGDMRCCQGFRKLMLVQVRAQANKGCRGPQNGTGPFRPSTEHGGPGPRLQHFSLSGRLRHGLTAGSAELLRRGSPPPQCFRVALTWRRTRRC